MRRFLKNSIIFTVGIIISLYFIDSVYSKVYNNSTPRNKTQYILSLKKGEKLDYVFLGSSRVENVIIPSIIKELTGNKTLNLGTQGAKLDDINIFLKLLIDRQIKIKRLFVQVDYTYNYVSSSDIVRSQSLPFIKSNSVIKEYLKKVDSNYYKNYYIPFYRYGANDYRIGFREFIASLINKKSTVDFETGYVPIYGSIINNNDQISSLPIEIIETNKVINEIDALCKANNIQVTYFCSPFCSKLKTNNYLLKLKSKLPNFQDFSSVIKEDSLFKNCSHLNKAGAEKFTRHIVKKLNL